MHGCHDFQQWSMNRRCLMRIGSLGLAGLCLPRLLQAEDQATSGATMASLVARANISSSCTSAAAQAISIRST